MPNARLYRILAVSLIWVAAPAPLWIWAAFAVLP
jgi:hypothetical protein